MIANQEYTNNIILWDASRYTSVLNVKDAKWFSEYDAKVLTELQKQHP